MLKEALDQRSELQKFLFIRGFLVSDKKIENLNEFPFYDNWNEVQKDGYYFYTHNKASVHFASNDKTTLFLIGHCYDPFLMEIEEEKILADILKYYGTDKYYDRISEITGVLMVGGSSHIPYVRNAVKEKFVDINLQAFKKGMEMVSEEAFPLKSN